MPVLAIDYTLGVDVIAMGSFILKWIIKTERRLTKVETICAKCLLKD
jgi:hypothetical protein